MDAFIAEAPRGRITVRADVALLGNSEVLLDKIANRPDVVGEKQDDPDAGQIGYLLHRLGISGRLRVGLASLQTFFFKALDLFCARLDIMNLEVVIFRERTIDYSFNFRRP
jgi:hypothetical protein